MVALRGVPGVYGARVTGAGFGGCVVALCQPKTRLKLPVLWRGRPAGGAWGSVSPAAATAGGAAAPRRRGAHPPPEQVLAVHQHHRCHLASSGTWRSRNGYGSRRQHHVGPAGPSLLQRHRRVAVVGVGEHVVDPDAGQQRRAVGPAGEAHPWPLPHGDEGPEAGGADRCRGARSTAPDRRPPGRRAFAAPAPRRPPPSIDRAAVRTPASVRASASSRRFSSTHSTTRSGRSPTMAPTSGSLVPPTCGRSGCSQNRVHATGSRPTPAASPVTEGRG